MLRCPPPSRTPTPPHPLAAAWLCIFIIYLYLYFIFIMSACLQGLTTHLCLACLVALQLSGTVDQSGSMLSDDVAERGYTLLCMAQPQSDCKIATITEVRRWRCCAVRCA